MAKRKEARLLEDRKNTKLSREEQETHIYLDALSDRAVIDTTVPKDYNKALRRGWKPAVRYLASDGTVIGYSFTVPRSLISFRSPRDLSPEEKEKIAKRLHPKN